MTWPTVALKDVARIVGGATPKTSDPNLWDGPIFWATPKDLSGLQGAYISSTPRTITAKGLASCSSELLPPNSVLFSSRAPIGHVAINTVPMATNQGFKSMIPGQKLDPRFLYWWLDANRSNLQAMGVGATFKEVSKATVERIEIPLPPLEEQKRIAAILDQADALRRLRARALTRLNALGQAIFHEMFGDVRLNSHKFPMPKFGDFAEVKLGKMLDRGKATGADQFPYLRNANVRWFDFDLSDLSLMEFSPSEFSRFSVRAGDLMICEGGEPGRCAVWRDESKEIFYQKALHRARLDTKIALPDYVAQWFAAAAGVGAFDEAVTVATISHLTGEKIKALQIMLPPISEQKAFCDRLHSVSVASRVIVDALPEQLGPLALPVLEGGDGRSALQG